MLRVFLYYHTSVEKLTESYILGSNISLFEINAQKPTLSGKAATSPIAKMLGILVLNMESTYKEEPTDHLMVTKKFRQQHIFYKESVMTVEVTEPNH